MKKTYFSVARLAQADDINPIIRRAFYREKQKNNLRQTHFFHHRFENTYIDLNDIPELTPVVEAVLARSRALLGRSDLKYGFWFNEMQPGDVTSLHNHDELDELLSCVYYIHSRPNSGDFILHLPDKSMNLVPQEGNMILFSPALNHEVTKNLSDITRLSVAFNVGPADN